MEISISQLLESPSYEMQKGIIAREMNKAQIEIDRNVFKKSREEKDLLKTMKLNMGKLTQPKSIGIFQF